MEPELLEQKLPEADLYICTGDMYANYPVMREEEVSQPFQPPVRYYAIDPAREPGFQRGAAASFIRMGGFRRFMGSPDVPVVLVAGNHDFIPLSFMFEDCNILHEFVNNELIEWNGVRITGHQGIPYIYGTWNHEMQIPDLQDRVRAMPDADIFVTHYPPQGILDAEYSALGLMRASYGLGGMAQQLWNKVKYFENDNHGSYPTKALHCFGHIHGSGGRVEETDGFHFSNAAEAANVIDIEF